MVILLIKNIARNNQAIIGLIKRIIETALYNHNIIEAKPRFFNNIIKLEQNKISQLHIIIKWLVQLLNFSKNLVWKLLLVMLNKTNLYQNINEIALYNHYFQNKNKKQHNKNMNTYLNRNKNSIKNFKDQNNRTIKIN
jgi:hypothetical protein